ncbi:MAG: hypothetical protein H6585_12345 [Flavobacteriales bacterium]|nr:hypothetical protein [Flavobacteriales bacterium]MCB9449120.1 hypothetical protein [Flavobacteriales bacterium]
MRKRIVIGAWLLVTCLPICSHGQFLDSIRSSLREKPKFLFGFDSRRSFLFSSDAAIFGIKAGLDYGSKVRMGAGYYFLSSPFYRKFITYPDTVYARFDLAYFSPYIEYVLLHDTHWECSVPLQLGFGSIGLRDTATGENVRQQGITLLELSIVGHYKIWDWLGVGSGVGYRQALVGSRIIEESVSAPIYLVKLKIFTGVIYRKFFPKRDDDPPPPPPGLSGS